MSEFVFSDRYQALGIPYPDPATMCRGQCEGTGWVPVSPPPGFEVGELRCVDVADGDTRLDRLWFEAHERCPWLFTPCDGWHFVKCPDCNGTGVARAPGGGEGREHER